jgi:uncharacterized membrane protein
MQSFSLVAMVLFFCATGGAHLLWPAPFLKITPPWVPWPKAVNLGMGLAECALALLLLLPRTHAGAAWGLLVVLAEVFPANLRMLRHKEASLGIARPWLLLRIPMQGVLMGWVWSQLPR